jgi:hypothetical protein
MQIPTEEQWGDYKDELDEEYAHRMFAGKSNDEMQVAFEENVLARTEDFRYMPRTPFRYYMLEFKQFIESCKEDYDDRSDAASCFICLVEDAFKCGPDDILPILDQVLPTVKYIAENQRWFDADIDIYGDFKEIYQNILRLAERIS